MAKEQEIKELKEQLSKLEAQIEKLKQDSRGVRPGWMNFSIAFVIVIAALLIGFGVFQFISAGSSN